MITGAPTSSFATVGIAFATSIICANCVLSSSSTAKHGRHRWNVCCWTSKPKSQRRQNCTLPCLQTDWPTTRHYDALIAQGFADNPSAAKTEPRPIGRPKQSPPKNLLDRLHKHKAGVLAFMYDFRIPFDNNLVERDVRMIKVQQKVSGCFRTLDGAHLFCALRSYISTARKHGINAIDAIYNAFLDQPFILNPPRLSSYPKTQNCSSIPATMTRSTRPPACIGPVRSWSWSAAGTAQSIMFW